jgi:hypothetical protein
MFGKIQLISNPLWELAVATIVATTCFVAYRYIDAKRDE